jgi:hypothetical protein
MAKNPAPQQMHFEDKSGADSKNLPEFWHGRKKRLLITYTVCLYFSAASIKEKFR